MPGSFTSFRTTPEDKGKNQSKYKFKCEIKSKCTVNQPTQVKGRLEWATLQPSDGVLLEREEHFASAGGKF